MATSDLNSLILWKTDPRTVEVGLATLSALRAKHGDKLENWWKEAFGYGFEFLTESEARYLERADEAQFIRDRLIAARQAGHH